MPQCPSCQHDNVRVAKFCIECGAKLTTQMLSQQERKRVTVLFADVSGFTRLSERLDPEELTELTGEMYRVMGASVYKYGGTVDKYLGDGVMVLFGAPKSHENDNERALLCALEIRRQLGAAWLKRGIDLEVSIGINAGIVISGKVGDDQRQDFTALGDVVNVAKRFEENAVGGQILVAESIYRDLKNRFEWRSLDRISVKGKSEKLKVFELTKLASQRDQEMIAGVGLARLIGREAELGELEQTLAAVAKGRGFELAIVGEAGMGKSRMMHELRYVARKLDLGILRGACASHLSSQPWSLMASMLRNQLGLNEFEDEETALLAVESLLDAFGEDPERHERVGVLAHILGYRYPACSIDSLSSRERDKLLEDTLTKFLLQEASRTPLIIVFDDLHWVDKPSVRFLESFRRSLGSSTVGIILAGREDEIPKGEVTLPDRIIRLHAFTREHTEEYLRSVLVSSDLPAGLVDLLHARCRGNPFFCEEMIKSLLVEKVVQRQGTRFVLTKPLDDVQAPMSVQELLMSRIDKLEADVKRVLQCASVIGETFPMKVLKDVMVDMGIDLEPALKKLTGAQMIVKRNIGETGEYAFSHSLLREVAYGSLLRKHQKDLHLKVAHAIEKVCEGRLSSFGRLLAHHYQCAGRVPQAMKCLLEEAERLLDSGEDGRAREAVVEVRSLMVDPEVHGGLYLDQVRLQLALGMGLVEESLGGLETDDPVDLLRMAQLRALVSSAVDIGRLGDLASLHPDPLELGVTVLLQSWAALRLGETARACEYAEMALQHFDGLDSRSGRALAVEAMALAALQSSEAAKAKELFARSLALMGSDRPTRLGWLRLTPLVAELGESTLFALVDLWEALDQAGISGRSGHFLEDVEVLGPSSITLVQSCRDALQPLLERRRGGLLRLLAFRGMTDLVVRPASAWVISEGGLPSLLDPYAAPGSWLKRVSQMAIIRTKMGVDREAMGDPVRALLIETRQMTDDQRCDVLGLAGLWHLGGFPSQALEGMDYAQKAQKVLKNVRTGPGAVKAAERLESAMKSQPRAVRDTAS
ncbi:MAG: adenylate/guanylate cyclase domain-containing protein [Planctomycetota bacterium]